MTGFDYVRSQATAARLLKRFGAAAILRKVNPVAGASNPWAPDMTLVSIDQAISAVLVNYTDVERANELILQQDRKAIIAAKGLSAAPVAGDTIVVGARAFTIVNLDTVEPGAVPIVFIAQVRL